MTDLRQELRPLADPGTFGPPGSIDEVRRLAVRRRRRRRTSFAVVVLAVVVVAVLGTGSLLGQSDSYKVEVVDQPAKGNEEVGASGDESLGWTELDPGPLDPRESSALVWTGDEFIVWGGPSGQRMEDGFENGAAYEAATRTWRMMSDSPLPGGPAFGIWTGVEVLIWSSNDADTQEWAGAAWDPGTDTWRAIAAPAAPEGSQDPTHYARGETIWTGEEVLAVDLLQRYDPAADEWRPMASPERPEELAASTWTGEELVVTRRRFGTSNPAAYDPRTDTWADLPIPENVQAMSTAMTWDGTHVYVLDYDMGAARYEPGSEAWEELPDVPLRFFECPAQVATIAGQVVAGYCSGIAVWDEEARAWAVGAPSRFGQWIQAGDRVFDWRSSDEANNFPDAPVTHFSSYRPDPSFPHGLALDTTIPVGTSMLDLPPDARVTATSTSQSDVGALPEIATELRFTLATPTGECTITSTHGGVFGPAFFAQLASEPGAQPRTYDFGPVEYFSPEEQSPQQGYALEPGLRDELAHVYIEQTTSDVLDIACPDLAQAEELAVGVHH